MQTAAWVYLIIYFLMTYLSFIGFKMLPMFNIQLVRVGLGVIIVAIVGLVVPFDVRVFLVVCFLVVLYLIFLGTASVLVLVSGTGVHEIIFEN
jgi:hypothetical protein